jgi:hypothetical protein
MIGFGTMLRGSALLSFLSLFVVVGPASASIPTETSIIESASGHTTKLSDLRSAYLLRAGLVHYDSARMSPAGLREQLRSHFDVVIRLLYVATSRSIESALVRLEAASGRTWSDAERSSWRRQLISNRSLQILRLAVYRDRGLFPLNEGQADEPVPIFVDNHDTACAVGHLMRMSGWAREVALIQRSNNLVYVPNAAHTSVAAWTLTSGLTLEEAALVQPGYPGPSPQISFEDLLLDGTVIEFDGLRLSNFELIRETGAYNEPAANVSVHDSFCMANPTYSLCRASVENPTIIVGPPTDSFGAAYDTEDFVSGFGYSVHVQTHGTHWLFLGAPALPDGLGMQSTNSIAERLTLGFSVTVLDQHKKLDELTLGMNPFVGGFFERIQYENAAHIYADVYSSAVFFPGLTIPVGRVAGTHIGGPDGVDDGHDFRIDPVSFAGLKSAYIQVQALTAKGQSLDAFVLHFNVVPEPMSRTGFLLGVTLLSAICGRFRTFQMPSTFAVTNHRSSPASSPICPSNSIAATAPFANRTFDPPSPIRAAARPSTSGL